MNSSSSSSKTIAKRKRQYGNGTVAKYRRADRQGQKFEAGYDRTAGFYGRFQPLGSELKFFDSNASGTIVAAGSITNSLCQILQGTSEQERIGRKCVIKSLFWRNRIELVQRDAVAAPVAGTVNRFIIYLDKQTNGAAAVVTDILETASWQSFRNLANQMRFDILMDESWDMNYMNMASDGVGTVSHSSVVKELKFYKKCNIPLEFSGTGGAITELRSNNIGILQITSEGTHTVWDSKIRLRFSDN